MDDLIRQALLYDFYGELLTEKQREICRLHFHEDLSLSEIAEEVGISRQGVSDALKHATASMEKTEEKLRMVRRYVKMQGDLDEMEKALDLDDKKSVRDKINSLRDLYLEEYRE